LKECFSTDSSESDEDEVSDDEDYFVYSSAKAISMASNSSCEKPVAFQHATIRPSLFNPKRSVLVSRKSCSAITRLHALQQDDSSKSLL